MYKMYMTNAPDLTNFSCYILSCSALFVSVLLSVSPSFLSLSPSLSHSVPHSSSSFPVTLSFPDDSFSLSIFLSVHPTPVPVSPPPSSRSNISILLSLNSVIFSGSCSHLLFLSPAFFFVLFFQACRISDIFEITFQNISLYLIFVLLLFFRLTVLSTFTSGIKMLSAPVSTEKKMGLNLSGENLEGNHISASVSQVEMQFMQCA